MHQEIDLLQKVHLVTYRPRLDAQDRVGNFGDLFKINIKLQCLQSPPRHSDFWSQTLSGLRRGCRGNLQENSCFNEVLMGYFEFKLQ